MNSYWPQPSRQPIRLPPGTLPRRPPARLPERRTPKALGPATVEAVRAHQITAATEPTGTLERMAKQERRDVWRDRILLAVALITAAVASRFAPPW